MTPIQILNGITALVNPPKTTNPLPPITPLEQFHVTTIRPNFQSFNNQGIPTTEIYKKHPVPKKHHLKKVTKKFISKLAF